MQQEKAHVTNFIRNIIEEDLKNGKNGGKVITRFPPEPNGYLHIGHAKSICLNFGLAESYRGNCFLRFDDTNPEKESQEYMDAIREDVTWLGFSWIALTKASDYFDRLYDFACELVRRNLAYVDDLSAEQIREYRGTLSEPGRNSPFRDRTPEENLALLEGMKAGKFADGEKLLRAKIDMASPNINMRDPAIYRIRKVEHHSTGKKWCIYPMYDFTHCISDSLEGITHSLCTLEFEDHRPLYDWFLDVLELPVHPQQIEFSRLNLEYTVMSKRKLNQLVSEKHVSGWDDPRMPTIAGLRRRGYTPSSIRRFADLIGISKSENNIPFHVLEDCVRDELNREAPRRMAVLKPLKVIITNLPENHREVIRVANHPDREDLGSRDVVFSREIYIEQDDFMENPVPKYFRLSPGREVRLKYAYFATCEKIIHDASGAVSEVHCRIDPDSKGGNAPDGRKVKGTIHWVSAAENTAFQTRIYDRLFKTAHPDKSAKEIPLTTLLNPDSLAETTAYGESALATDDKNQRFQFERLGYFWQDRDSGPGGLIFNRIASLRDSWQAGNA